MYSHLVLGISRDGPLIADGSAERMKSREAVSHGCSGLGADVEVAAVLPAGG